MVLAYPYRVGTLNLVIFLRGNTCSIVTVVTAVFFLVGYPDEPWNLTFLVDGEVASFTISFEAAELPPETYDSVSGLYSLEIPGVPAGTYALNIIAVMADGTTTAIQADVLVKLLDFVVMTDFGNLTRSNSPLIITALTLEQAQTTGLDVTLLGEPAITRVVVDWGDDSLPLVTIPSLSNITHLYEVGGSYWVTFHASSAIDSVSLVLELVITNPIENLALTQERLEFTSQGAIVFEFVIIQSPPTQYHPNQVSEGELVNQQ